ncbi:MAG: PEP-CTERM sorting domain-containing protein [Fimbriimonadaceae bacterium]
MSVRPLLLLPVFGFAVLSGSASAASFTNIFINGVLASSGNPTLFGTSGLTFSLPNHFLVGVGTKTVTLDYTVTADPGKTLTMFSFYPVGVAKYGTVTIDNDHTNGGTQTNNYSVSAGSTTITLPSSENNALTPSQTSFNVHTAIKLTSSNIYGVNKVTLYSVSYTEAVPEPASLAAIGLGLGAILARRRKGSK